MELLEMSNTIKNDLNHSLEEKQKSFLETTIGKTINSAIDIGLKAVLPNLIEDQIIDIKDIILNQGFKEGLPEIINTGLDFGKSAMGLITGDFENISQVQTAVKKGGIIDSVSKLLDFSIDLAYKSNLISNDIAKVIRSGKNTLMDTISSKVENELTKQISEIEKLEGYCNKWQEAFENKDITSMNKIYKNIQRHEEKIIPLEKIIESIKRIDNIQQLIKSKENTFNFSENELALVGQI